MVRQINPSLARLWIGDRRQYGYSNPVGIEPTTPATQRALEYLEAGISNNQLPNLGKIVGTTNIQIGDLLSRISSVLVQTTSFLPELSPEAVEQKFAEIMRLFLTGSLDPAESLKNRSASRVFVSALDRTGLVLLQALSAVGIGTIFTQDQQRVLARDTLNLGHPESSLGETRISSARAILGQKTKTQLHSRVSGVFNETAVSVIIGTDVINPADYQIWMSRDVPHIAITFDELGVQVSHLVIPGVTPCLSCVALEKLNSEPNWQFIAPQLNLLDRDLGDTAVLLFATGVVVNAVLNLIDFGHQAGSKPQETRFDRRTGSVLQREVLSPNCGCKTSKETLGTHFEAFPDSN